MDVNGEALHFGSQVLNNKILVVKGSNQTIKKIAQQAFVLLEACKTVIRVEVHLIKHKQPKS